MIDLRNRVPGEVLDYQTLLHALNGYRKPRDKITALMRSGDIVRVKKGLYIFGKAHRRRPFSMELVANLVYGPSYVSLDTALTHYSMIPERTVTITSVTTAKTKSFRTPLGFLSYRHLAAFRYASGVDRIQTATGAYLIATPEKALLDKVWTDRRFTTRSRLGALSYLTDDLRIDLETLRGLKAAHLKDISDAYKSERVRLAMECVVELQGPS